MKISFCHYGNEKMASYRYRARIPAKEMGADINNPNADVIVFAKPIDQDVKYVLKAQKRGAKVIADFCDMHFHLKHYEVILQTANAVTCTTQWFSDYIRSEYGIEPVVIPDPYEFEEKAPHCNGDKLLWFGHGANFNGLARVFPLLEGHPIAIVSNIEGAIPWSLENMVEQFAKADIVVMPETAPYKSPNRTVEAIRQGCFVVAEPHPAINDIPGIWIGNIRKGIEWAQQNPSEARERTRIAQSHVSSKYSPAIQADAWRTAIQKALSSSTSAVGIFNGTDGQVLMPTKAAGIPVASPI